jgi:hypothetical protein
MDLFKKYLLTSAARFSPPGEGGEPELEGEEHVEETVPNEGEDEGLGEDAGAEEGPDGAGEDAEGDGEGSIDAQPEPRRNRAGDTIRQLRARVQTETTERQRIDRELQELRAAQRQREQQNQQESPTDRAARRALMDPTEVLREDMRESEERTRNLLQQQAMQQQETSDKLGYNSILRDAPHLRKYDAEVEKIRLEQQARGVFVPREVLLDLAIGRAARAAATKKAPAARQQAAARVAAQQSRPAAARGDTATQRGKQGDSLEKRLENVPI